MKGERIKVTMIFIAGLAAGWIAGSMAVVVCSICVSSSDHEREKNDKEQMEYLEKWSEKHREI